MDNYFKDRIYNSFVSAIDMLKEIVELCPKQLWEENKQFFYLSYHTTIFLDYYLSRPVVSFDPMLPYTLGDPDNLPTGAIDDVLPNHFYSREEIINYLATICNKAKVMIKNTSAETMTSRWITEEEIPLHNLCSSLVVQYSVLDIWLYNLRHLQHHVGQLNLILRRDANAAAAWV